MLDQLIDFEKRHRLVALLGNHEEMMLRARESAADLETWMQFGGLSTLASYGDDRLDAVPRAHWEFLERCRLFHETETHFCHHANYRPEKPLADQDRHDVLWLNLQGLDHPGQVVGGVDDCSSLVTEDRCMEIAEPLGAPRLGVR